MAGLTPADHFGKILDACAASTVVESYEVRTLDSDILSMRVHLVSGDFIEVFYNQATPRTSFALIAGGQRVYGKDNAKMGWHVHPVDAPDAHRPCAPVSFEQFLVEVTGLRYGPDNV